MAIIWSIIVHAFPRTEFRWQVRKANRDVVILHYALDTYPSPAVIEMLDVDAFLTNSRVLLPRLQKAREVIFLQDGTNAPPNECTTFNFIV